MTRLASRPWLPGDPLPAVGSVVMVAGANSDITSDQDRSYQERRVIGYSPDLNFVCFQTRDCWPTVERLPNCWFFGDIVEEESKPDVEKLLAALTKIAKGQIDWVAMSTDDMMQIAEDAVNEHFSAKY